MQGREGFERGANKSNVYNGLRTASVPPTRLWVDAHTTRQWRNMGFFELNTSRKPEENLFFSLLKLRAENPKVAIKKQVAQSAVCPDTLTDLKELGMPYGFPPLNSVELSTMRKWIEAGAPVETPTVKVPVKTQKQIKEWEKFLNGSSNEEHLVARYIFEHLFLAHIHFPEDSNLFFKLIRSKTACSKNPMEIATRRPNDDPGVKKFYYCLTPFTGTVVRKTHIPYQLSSMKLSRVKEIFYETKWKASSTPSYARSVAENPFLAFKDIPTKARYRFLLEDSQYHVATFIKGPVCNGSNAVNSIQEQFYVFFMEPESDKTVFSKSYSDEVAPLLMLPGVFGSDVDIKETPLFYKTLIDHREKYRKIRVDNLKTFRPEGYVLNDIWNGDKTNPNAVLTVFRHDDNAVVKQGAIGDLPKTVFVLDYPLFERLVYNLVVNFDVFGNVSHQFLTRVYMDMIRMEAEELFLMFLPPEERLTLRREWYRGLLADVKMTYVFPTVGSAEPTGVKFTYEKATKKQMIEKILFYRLTPEARGKLDALNWKNIETPEQFQNQLKADELQKTLREMASIKAISKTPFARFFPDLAMLKVRTQKDLRVFSIIRNKEHENISWIMGESLRMAPEEDTLTIKEDYMGSYPNMIFSVEEAQVGAFVNQVKSIKTEKDFNKLVIKFGIPRTNPEFWQHYDELTAHQKKTADFDFGYLDLTRYSL
ncbi:isomerase [Bdellovibrio bacteriovorus]|uniref:Isomerase n=1 Tax=Bdellovibrio bacteriovorus TaxID=959 RepID=A0A150WM39_BDEBC|nr:isomerase [Bdellovibrio bacteriovorus]